MVETLSVIYKCRDATEKTITEALNTLMKYLQIFNEQLIVPITNKAERYEKLAQTTFLAQITDDLITFCQSYFDSVRDVAS